MGKIEKNKQQKFENLLNSAQELFLSKGVEETSISDITNNANVAKGTFYLYFRDKTAIRDYLVILWSRRLFSAAHQELQHHREITGFEDKIIFIIDHIVLELSKNKPLQRFIAKNLSWGLFKHLLNNDVLEERISGREIFESVVQDCGVTVKNPEIMAFIIVEMTNSTTYSAIMENAPIPLEQLLPHLNEAIRSIIRTHLH
ncbi:MAG: TetR/AcrR family transcriptional regulator [Lachnospiraceae bacterium]|nr:TetR/AcrR family transcriptional regulator [Lachnospiraceae bacterium]